MEIHIDLAVLLAIVLFFRLRPTGEPRSSGSVQVTAAIVLIFGLLLAGTETGRMLLGLVGEVAGMVN
jgi:hypothetical protein